MIQSLYVEDTGIEDLGDALFDIQSNITKTPGTTGKGVEEASVGKCRHMYGQLEHDMNLQDSKRVVEW